MQRGNDIHVRRYEKTLRPALFEVAGYSQPIEGSSEISL